MNFYCLEWKFQPLTMDVTKDRYTGRFHLRLDSLFVPNANRFKIRKMSIYPNKTEPDLVNLAKLANQQRNERKIKTNLKKRILKQTQGKKSAESFEPISEKLTEVKKSTEKLEEFQKETWNWNTPFSYRKHSKWNIFSTN